MEIVPFGDSALLVRLEGPITPHGWRRLQRLREAIDGASVPGVGGPVPGASTLLVPFDPLVADPSEVEKVVLALEGRLEDATDHGAPAIIELPTRYGGQAGPDLAAVARRADLSEAAVVRLHASVEYEVAFLGFAPGFAYCGSVPTAIATPRLHRPRERVPAGSVGIADTWTAVYPGSTAGGWNLIGRTNTSVWDPRRRPPALLAPGLRVRFVPGDA